MAVLALLEDIVMLCRIRREWVFMIFWLMMVTGLSADSDIQELSS